MTNITRRGFLKGLGVFAAAVALKVKGAPDVEPEAVDDAPMLEGMRDDITFKDEYIDVSFGDGDLPLYSSLRVGNEIIYAGSFVYLDENGYISGINASDASPLMGVVINDAQPGEDVWMRIG